MTEKRACNRYFGAFICILLCFALVACGRSSGELFDFQPGEESDSHKSACAGYRIVVAKGSSAETLSAAQKLFRELADRTGIPCSLCFEGEENGAAGKEVCEILIGYVERAVSRDRMWYFKRDDYLCEWQDGCLLLGGKSDSANLAAIRRFSEEILPYADDELLMNPDGGFLYRAEYEIPTVSVDGPELFHYRIVYPAEGNKEEKEIAFAFRDRLADMTGYYPAVEDDRTAPADALWIAFGDCAGSEEVELTGNHAVMFRNVGHIFFLGTDAYGICYAAQEFLDGIRSSAVDGVCTLTTERSLIWSYENPRLTLGVAVPGDEEDVLERTFALGGEIMEAKPDITAVFALTEQQIGIMKNILPDYNILSFVEGENCYSAILYHRERLNARQVGTPLTLDGCSVRLVVFTPEDGGDPFAVFLTGLWKEERRGEVAEALREGVSSLGLSCVVMSFTADGIESADRDMPDLTPVAELRSATENHAPVIGVYSFGDMSDADGYGKLTVLDREGAVHLLTVSLTRVPELMKKGGSRS